MTRRGRILLVDDDEEVRELLGLALERAGYRVRLAADGAECLRSALTMRPDLILLNYLMPVMDGMLALRRIKTNPVISYLKVVMYSAVSDFEAFRAAALGGGARACLKTPFNLNALRAAVEDALRS